MFDELDNVKFITVEGADGTGKDTVAQELHKSLKGSLLVSFPYRFNLTGRLIDDILQKKKPMLDPLSFQSLMLANKIETLKDICKTICTNEKPSHIIFARYLQSSIVYGMLDEIPANFTVKINRVLPESNNVFILHGKVYKNFENKAEYYETERKQERVSALYLKCAEDFGWNILDNNRPVKSIVSEILSTIGEQP